MSEFKTPAGRLVQGMLEMQQRKDITTKQPVWKDAAKTIPDMGTFFSLAFPKVVNGAANPEFAEFYAKLVNEAATSWPALFPQGASGTCTDRRFSWKLQDGDGTDFQGQSVASKPGFAGHWIVKFDTNFPIKVFNDGQFAPHQELADPAKIVKRGYWVRVYGEMKSNMATGTQVPGIVLYPNLVSFLGGRREDEIVSGPDAQTAFGAAHAGWRPEGISAVPGAPVGTALALPLPTTSIAAPVAPSYVVRADLATQGHTLQSLAAVGTTDQLLTAGYITVVTPTPAALALPTPAVLALPTPAVLALPVLGAALPTPGLPAPGGSPALGGLPNLPAAGPHYELSPTLRAQLGPAADTAATIAGLLAKGWNHDALVGAGHLVKIG